MGHIDRKIFSSVINLGSAERADIQRLSDLTSSFDPKLATNIENILFDFTPSYYTLYNIRSFRPADSTF